MIDISHPKSPLKMILTPMFRVFPLAKVLVVDSLSFVHVKT